MCDICIEAAKEIRDFAEQLVEKYPATLVDGAPVNRTHHVTVGLLGVADEYLTNEVAAATGVADLFSDNPGIAPFSKGIFSTSRGGTA